MAVQVQLTLNAVDFHTKAPSPFFLLTPSTTCFASHLTLFRRHIFPISLLSTPAFASFNMIHHLLIPPSKNNLIRTPRVGEPPYPFTQRSHIQRSDPLPYAERQRPGHPAPTACKPNPAKKNIDIIHFPHPGPRSPAPLPGDSDCVKLKQPVLWT